MNEPWLKLDELVALTGWSHRAVQLKAQKGQLSTRRRSERARNGRPVAEYSVLSLPPTIQIEFHRRAAERQRAETVAAPDAGQLVLFEARNAASTTTPRVPVTEAHNLQIEGRLKAIGPLIEYLRLETKEARQSWCAQRRLIIGNADALAKHLARANDLSAATIWRWYGKYKIGGSSELFDGSRRDKGQSRWFARHPKAIKYVAAKYWGERMSVPAIRRGMERDRALLDLDAASLPSCDTLREFIQSLPDAPAVLARDGERKFNEECLPYLKRGYTDIGANEIWVSDHMISDVLTWDDCFERDGKALRLRLTMVLDFRTRKALGYTFCLEGSSWSITSALRNAIMEFGPCKRFYADNGKDYKKVAKGASPRPWWSDELERVTGLLERLGIQAQHCLPYHPQSKHVERSFRTIHQQFDAKFTAGYTTGKTSDRPDSTRVAERQHSELLKAGRVEESPLCPASVYIEAFRAWVENVYNAAPHRGEGMNGRSPNQVFDELYPPTGRPHIDLMDVAHLFYERAKRKVDSCAIRHDSRRYIGATAEAATALLARHGESIWLAWDKNDPEAALAIDDDGRIIAPLRLETLVPHSEAAQPMISASMALRRRMANQVRNGISAVNEAARLMGVRTEREHLEIAARLSDAGAGSVSLTLITQRASPQHKSNSATERIYSEDNGEILAADIRRAHA